MGVDILRANYDDLLLQFDEGVGFSVKVPTFSNRYSIYGTGAVDPVSQQRVDYPAANDYAIQNYVNRFGTPYTTQVQGPIYSSGIEFLVRSFLAQLGFKPDANSFRKGHPFVPVEMSRVQDLEAVNAQRNGYSHINTSIQSHVVPYTYASFVATSAVMDIATNGWGGAGLFAPYPWPRILTCWRVYDVTNARRHAPRGSKVASVTSSGPDWVAIKADGTLSVSTSIDNVRFSNAGTHGSIAGLVPGNTYEIQLGHSEPFAGSGNAPNQRWFSAAYGNQDWVTGSPIPP